MGSNPAIPTTGSGVRAVAVLGAETAVGAAIVDELTATGFSVAALADHEPMPPATAAVIDAGPLREPTVVGDLVSLAAADWRQEAEVPLRRARLVLQAAHRCLQDAGGRVVVLLPSVVMTGAAGVAAWAAAAEGYRSLTKAAARAWGADRISIQCVVVPVSLCGGSVADRPGLQPPALGRTPGPRADIAPAIAALLDPRFDAVTGSTLAIDGGVWMTP
ncbi:MAG TPA: SDR family oxidoreductase [Mycobacteriales bacterium]|nr:SDR family oxidoreductase [Mycobacteriales bacterium]